MNIKEILEDNLRKELENKGTEIFEPRRSRRKRDYLILMIFVNSIFIAISLMSFPNFIVMIYCFSGVVLFSSGITWVMWQVMNDY